MEHVQLKLGLKMVHKPGIIKLFINPACCYVNYWYANKIGVQI